MPDHVINEIVLRGQKLEECGKHLLNKSGEISFAVLAPLPLNFWPGSFNNEHQKDFPGTHGDAAIAMWGTDRDAYGDPTVEDGEDGVVLRFLSAWCHPRGWVCAIFNTLNCDITTRWLCEEGSVAHAERYFAEHLSGRGGPHWEVEEIPNGSDEFRRLHRLLCGGEAFEDEPESTTLMRTAETGRRT